MGPKKAAELFLKEAPDSVVYRVTLFGSLAATGRGHLTDKTLEQVFKGRKLRIDWQPDKFLPEHPNGMRFEAINSDGVTSFGREVFSIGGGAIKGLGDDEEESCDIYQLNSMAEIIDYCEKSGESFWSYVKNTEGEGIEDFLESIWETMSQCIEAGLSKDGSLPGGLGLSRKARSFFQKSSLYGSHFQRDGHLCAYAHAVAEENACGGTIVTAPTCGSSGVLPAVLRHLKETLDSDQNDIIRALGVAGLVGNLVKHNASISGAEVGCQGGVGTACGMAAAADVKLHGGSLQQIEYAAEMGLAHHLGLTCDPVMGLVQIPCIERNAHAASRALSCSHFALLTDGRHKIPFDIIVSVMKETGQALPLLYRETSRAGIAKAYQDKHGAQETRD
jgi:L-serine dehydratase